MVIFNSELLIRDKDTGQERIVDDINDTIKLFNTINIESGNLILNNNIVNTTAIIGQLSDSTSQKPSTTNPTAITFDTNDGLQGVTHATSGTADEIVIDTAGQYLFFGGGQVERTNSSGGDKLIHIFLQQDIDGSGFVDVPNSNVGITMDNIETDVLIVNVLVPLPSGSKVRFMQSIDSTTHGLGLVASTPAGEPAIPSIIASIMKTGDIL